MCGNRLLKRLENYQTSMKTKDVQYYLRVHVGT